MEHPVKGDLPKKQEQALAAYRGGFISIGKLARVMGMRVLELRHWLNERGIPQGSIFVETDGVNA